MFVFFRLFNGKSCSFDSTINNWRGVLDILFLTAGNGEGLAVRRLWRNEHENESNKEMKKKRIKDKLLAAGARVLALAAMAMGGALTALGDIGDLAGAADQRLAYITNAADYAAFEGWMTTNGIGLGDATNSPNAWASYALDASGLINPQDGDVAIVSLETVTNGTFTLEVAVSNVLIGSSATPKNLASVFEVEGAPSLTEPFSSTNVTAELDVSANGRLLVVAKPAEEVFGSAVLEKFFVRVRMHAEYDDWFISINGEPPTPPVTPPDDPHGDGVQLWEDGPYWAETNIGADEPWDYGYYFWWGDAVGCEWKNNKWARLNGSRGLKRSGSAYPALIPCFAS